MAKAVFENRNFTNQRTGEIVGYEWYGVIGVDSQGKRIELPLKNLNSAEKIAFKMVASCDTTEEIHGEVVQKTPSKGEKEEFLKHQKNAGSLVDDDEADIFG